MLATRVILVPINMGKHWTVMAIFPKHRIMLYLDSLWSLATHVFQWLFGYVETLFEIWNEALDIEKWVFINPHSTPKQDDDCNCGVFACINAYLACSMEPIEYSVNDITNIRYWVAKTLIEGKKVKRVKLTEPLKQISKNVAITDSLIEDHVPGATEEDSFHHSLLELLEKRDISREMADVVPLSPLTKSQTISADSNSGRKYTPKDIDPVSALNKSTINTKDSNSEVSHVTKGTKFKMPITYVTNKDIQKFKMVAKNRYYVELRQTNSYCLYMSQQREFDGKLTFKQLSEGWRNLSKGEIEDLRQLALYRNRENKRYLNYRTMLDDISINDWKSFLRCKGQQIRDFLSREMESFERGRRNHDPFKFSEKSDEDILEDLTDEFNKTFGDKIFRDRTNSDASFHARDVAFEWALEQYKQRYIQKPYRLFDLVREHLKSERDILEVYCSEEIPTSVKERVLKQIRYSSW